MDTIIEVSARSVYGSVLMYPANDQAARLAALVGTRTLTVSTLQHARGMGFIISVKGDERAAQQAEKELAK